ncbi:OmpA family protein [Formosa sediminum]|uniref:OmpA family protein n=1 Tax=Formosa sediminum TaxID=2594004 RepID=A0A516GU12_9FLAO|nr:OmpA family protein [Formosa sediminum]QDO94985.1 OmpA family protein [Formosa sediminum]
MKKITGILLAITLTLSSISCDAIKNANNTQKGAGVGVAGGALIGGLIGGNVTGALIGAAVGGAAGGVIGNKMDKQADKIEEALPGAEVNRVGEGIQVVFDENSGVTFDTNKADLTAKAKENLDAIAEVFVEFPDTNLLVEGHTDSTGNDAYNMTLSEKRAQAVVSYLQSKGVTGDRFDVTAYGETKPRFDNATAEGRSKNRRVEIGVSANQEMIEDAKAQVN